tara:strand:+ start:1542 stop:1748 length:207 start_codon:yes stop_codon:yes gene_type:complete
MDNSDNSWKKAESYVDLDTDDKIAIRLDREINAPQTTNVVIIDERRDYNNDLPLACCLGVSLLACSIL